MVPLIAVEEAFDGHCIHHLNQCLSATYLLSISLSDYSKHVLVYLEMLLVR